MAYPTCCVVRASIALPPGRSKFCATCGVTFKFRHSATKSAASWALSPPTVTCSVPGICSCIPSAASPSTLPLALNTSVFTNRALILHRQIPVATQLGFFALPLRAHFSSGSVFDAGDWFDRFSPWKSTLALPGSSGGGRVLRILALETLQTRPRLQPCSFHGEVLVPQQIPLRRYRGPSSPGI
jgi:hypothetical protein